MGGKALIRDIAEGLRAYPARASLAFASLTLGVSALVLLLAVMGGIRQRARDMVGELGVNVFGIVQSHAAGTSGHGELARRHIGLLSANLPQTLVTGVRIDDDVRTGTGSGVQVWAADENILRVRPWPLIAGRTLDAADCAAGARHAVISAALARAMNLSPGSTLSLGSLPFRVIGIVRIEPGAADLGEAQHAMVPGHQMAIVPWSVPAVWADERRSADSPLDAIFVKAGQPGGIESGERRARRLLDQPDYAVTGLQWMTPGILLERLKRIQRMIVLGGGTVVFLCLVLGGITLTGLLLSSLQARIPEIGLRRALGASPADIGLLFLGEAAVLAGAATVAGLLVASAVSCAVGTWTSLPIRLDPPAILIPLGCGVLLGAVFSYGPARLAARIVPSEALRNE